MFSDLSWSSVAVQHSGQLCSDWSGGTALCRLCNSIAIHVQLKPKYGWFTDDPDPPAGMILTKTFLMYKIAMYVLCFRLGKFSILPLSFSALHFCVLICSFVNAQFFFYSLLLFVFSQSLGLEVAPDFQPVLVSHQPNSAHQPLSEFFLQLGPDNFLLLQFNNGQIVTLRDFKPVRKLFSIFLFHIQKH